MTPRPAARLEVPETTTVAGGRLPYVVVNTGAVPLVLGVGFRLQRRAGSAWEDVALPYWFPALGLRLESGARHELGARIPEDVPPGRYRLRVRVPADRDPHPGYEWAAGQEMPPVEVSAEFDVAPAAAE